MKITYIGTAASEGLPALFCQCPICESARKNGGKEIRGRAAICVNETLLIDFPPDIYYGAMRAGVDLSKILDIVGDLRLAGIVKGHFIAVKSGHALNTQLAKQLYEALKK